MMVFSLYFGFRARDKSRKRCWGDLKLHIDPETGIEMFAWKVERGRNDKNCQRYDGALRRQFNPKGLLREQIDA